MKKYVNSLDYGFEQPLIMAVNEDASHYDIVHKFKIKFRIVSISMFDLRLKRLCQQ